MILDGCSQVLDNGGERVQLQDWNTPPADEPDYIPRLLEDEVLYDDASPWPVEADGVGHSLNRVAVDAWGHDATSWTAAGPTPGQVPVLAAPGVIGRYVFYHNSALATRTDDEAIAPDKQPLLPGGTATFANYTSYALGINGLMVDLRALPPDAQLGTGDFEFRVGTDGDPDTWPAAPTPTEITVRPGAGEGGTDRVTIVFDDYAITNRWLQVTVLATAETGLFTPDVFYFGNAVGESGDSAADAKVNATDVLLTRNNPRTFLTPAPIDFHFDFNRDSRVNATDMLITRNHQTHSLNALKLITAPEGKSSSAPTAGLHVDEGEVTLPTYDAVLETTTIQDWEAFSAKLDCSFEFELTEQLAKKKDPNEDAVDELLQMWPS